jgi:hypothetical protein
MSDELKKVYERAGSLAYFFEAATPTDLFRRRKVGDKTPFMQPTLIGFGPDERPRLPDIHLSDESGKSPQFRDGGGIEREPASKPLTKQIVADASKYTVRGCRTIKGNYRGVSVFDAPAAMTRDAEWFYIPEGTDIPPGLAVTKDGDKMPGKALHYTIAPKDDMPFTLFLQHLKGFEAVLKKRST